MTIPRRTQRLAAIAIGVVGSLALATSALATDCTNASKPAAAGVQVAINLQTGEIEWIDQIGSTNGITDGATSIPRPVQGSTASSDWTSTAMASST